MGRLARSQVCARDTHRRRTSHAPPESTPPPGWSRPEPALKRRVCAWPQGGSVCSRFVSAQPSRVCPGLGSCPEYFKVSLWGLGAPSASPRG